MVYSISCYAAAKLSQFTKHTFGKTAYNVMSAIALPTQAAKDRGLKHVDLQCASMHEC